jgi:hypothetical protein
MIRTYSIFKTLFTAGALLFSFAMAGEGSNSFTEMFSTDQTAPKANIENATSKVTEVATPGLAALTYYTDRATFDNDAPDIPLEDFEGGSAPSGQIVGCGSPVTSAASPCFGAGVIESGLEVHASSETNIVALGAGIVPVNATTWVGSDLFNDFTFLEFTNGDAYAVGLDIFDFFGSATITINVYGAGGLIGTNIALSGGFWGVISDEPIVMLVLGTPSNVIVLDNVAFGNPIIDTDGDGYPDDEDTCPMSDLGTNVVIDGCDSGVANLLMGDGCTISDLIAECAEGASNHGQFVSCVAHLTNGLKKDGLISGREKGAIQSCAAHSSLP